MNADTYSVLMVWSDEDQAFVAKVLELPGCMAHGETRAETIEQIGIAIENWLETARELGRKIPSPTHLADYEKELDQSAEESLKKLEAQFPNAIAAAMPAIIEALSKEMAKSGDDASILYSPQRGFRWLRRAKEKEAIRR